ncbi:MAG TPA: hypothetical protein VMH00_15300 [Candidatus Limnocylindrales bacterium]|nr:hypothetical protein [Candidatus Limnocylindrales bacterium]
MRRFLLISAAAVLLLPLAAWSRQSQSDTGSQSQASSSASSTQAQTQTKPQDSLAEAARRARAQKKENPNSKPAKVFTNENLPAAGGISTVGEESTSGEASANGAQPAGQGAAQSSGNDEKAWRAKFAELRHKLDQDQAELDVLQREASTDQVQFYGGDPEKATADQMSQQPMGADYNKKLAKLDAKKKQIEADKQAISDAEDELRKAGGDPGWAR